MSKNSTSKRNIVAINLLTNQKLFFDSIKNASDTLNVNLRCIFKVLSPKHKSIKIKNWSFEYV